MDLKELKRLLEEEYAWGNLDAEANKWFIDELLEDFLDILKKQLTLTDVSQQRELLLAYNKELNQHINDSQFLLDESDIDEFLVNYSC